MSREIHIWFDNEDGTSTNIEIRPPYYLLGSQSKSMAFWKTPLLCEIGISHLTYLGVTDPVTFAGWEMMADLERELGLLRENLKSVDFDPELRAKWLSHLEYCYFLLVLTAPKNSTPMLSIG